MEDFYYVKFKPIKYDDKPYYLSGNGAIKETPQNLRIFDNIDEAINFKRDLYADEKYQHTYMFQYYELSIERF